MGCGVGFIRIALVASLLTGTFYCKAGSNGSEPPNQGAVQQTAAGQIVANLSNRGISGDSRFTEQSMITLYLFKKRDYSLSCSSATDRKKCEDALIFKNEKVDSLGFTNEPGHFGYDADFNSYYPSLIADEGHNYPSTKPSDPPGFPDPDVWQCMRNPFQGNPNYNKFECGVNAHPIRYFNKNLTTYTLQVYATDGKGYASSYILDYNLFNSLNHPIKDGDRYYAYFAVHFNAMKAAVDSEDRFDVTASGWKRPIEPDLVSPRIEINVKLLAEGPYDKAGSVYDIPDFSTWYDPFAGCRSASGTPGSVYFSEIMWMGSKDTAATSMTDDEFVELYNNTASDINISGWKLSGVGGSDPIVLPLCAVIKAGSTYTVGKKTGSAFSNLNYVDTRVSLVNTGEALTISDAFGTTISSVSGCTSPAWGGNGVNGSTGAPKRSMRLTATTSPASTCATGGPGFWCTTSVSDASYAANSANVSSAYSIAADTGLDGTIATPGYAAPNKASCP
jgi:Lamin Tail Domain